jgi:hypothetical protein
MMMGLLHDNTTVAKPLNLSKRQGLHIHISARCKQIVLGGILLLLFSCHSKPKLVAPIFKTLDSKLTGIDFSNTLKPTPQFNLFSYMYYYNGAGVGAGDFNNDGKIDLFFSANQGDNKLYLNKGGLQFADVTKAATIPQDGGWSTGVSIIDINNDGLLDIYICKVGHYKVLHNKNQLLVCQGINKEGIPQYKDEAAAYGLDFTGFSTQAVFFDYDGDGDLDMFLLNHSVNHDGNYAPRKNFLNTYDSLAGQKLYRNDIQFADHKIKKGRFNDVTEQSGIHGSKIGYGLGVAVADINLDGWPDFYVGNDFHENDYLYINQKNGTFKDETEQRLMHTSQFSMGVDVADVNNDAYPEIISMDMLPNDPYILRRSLAEDDYTIFLEKLAYGYNYQYARNNLQLNRRNGMFTETAQYSGVYATDWSWASVWMDFNNDGKKDLFISNGIPKRMNDIDYINFVSNTEVQQKLRDSNVGEKDMGLISKFPEIKLPNKFYCNTGNMVFRDVTDSVDNNLPAFSNGTIYADLDNDGDLDIVVNNINDPVLIYENTSNNKKDKPFCSVQLKGADNNSGAIGAKLILFANGGIRTYENNPVHGFQSSMLEPLHVGLSNTKVDSAFLIWPDNTYQPVNLQPNQFITLAYQPGLPVFDYAVLRNYFKNPAREMEDITASSGLLYNHEENQFNEFNREPLIPRMISTEGPPLAIADINHDGLEDVFIGSSKTFHNAVFLQTPGGKFVKTIQPEMLKDSMWESTDAVWADVNNDTHPDLLLASGGNEYYGTDEHLLPLLYLNDGKGNLTRKNDAFTNIYTTQSSIAPVDFNNDGYVDLFIAGRCEPWNYGQLPRSYLLQNDGTGKFTDVTQQYAPALMYPGMVTSAQWLDMNADGKKDLLLTYEWGGIDAYINEGKAFTKKIITDKKGWWTFLLPVDIDQDGDIDFVAGNFGCNSRLKASPAEPVTMYFNDFDENGKKDQVVTYYLQGQEIPFNTKQDLEKQLPLIKKNFLYAEDFAKASLPALLGSNKLSKADKFTANYFSNAVILNKGNFQFDVQPLPWEAQLTTYRDAVVVDANNDHLPDLFLTGNFYSNNIQIGRQDGDFGTILINKGEGKFEYTTLNGVLLKGESRHVKPLQVAGKTTYIVSRNNDSLVLLRFK